MYCARSVFIFSIMVIYNSVHNYFFKIKEVGDLRESMFAHATAQASAFSEGNFSKMSSLPHKENTKGTAAPFPFRHRLQGDYSE